MLAKISVLVATVAVAAAVTADSTAPPSPTQDREAKIASANDSQLANLSTRGFVLTDDNVMIGGFVLGGSNNNTHIVVRGIGPSLAQFGLEPALADPTLELYDSNGTLLSANDDWQDNPAQASELTSFGLAPQNAKESAIFLALPPGAFTAVLGGHSGGTGIGMVEVYNLH
jgi:hypothetical protein